MTFWDVFITLAVFIPLVMLWVFTLIDLFGRTDLSGIAKALWAIAIVLLPLVGMLVYFLLRDDRSSGAAPRSGGDGTASRGAAEMADQLERLADLRDRGILTDDEFQREKDRLLGHSPS